MSTQFNLDKNHTNLADTHGKVRVTDLLNRLNEEKKIEKKKKSRTWCCRSFSSNSFWNNINNLDKPKILPIYSLINSFFHLV